ncbi:MAG: hypothetical protein HFJ75_09200 [Eggerthellaceae bacterium]|nr:hypothetical protein [Eggerthellaceae bacterium]
MIYLYSGTPGSGKSMHAAKEIRDALVWRRAPVVANFDVNPETRGYAERFRYVPNDALSPPRLYEIARARWGGRRVREDDILLVIDEAQLVFNSRDWSQRDRLSWIEFFSQHRKLGYRVVLIAQHDRMIDRQIRALIEVEVKHRRLASFGLVARLLSLPFAGRLFCAVSCYYGLGQRIGVSWLFPRRCYRRLYDSCALFRQVPGDARGRGQGAPLPPGGDRPLPAQRSAE